MLVLWAVYLSVTGGKHTASTDSRHEFWCIFLFIAFKRKDSSEGPQCHDVCKVVGQRGQSATVLCECVSEKERLVHASEDLFSWWGAMGAQNLMIARQQSKKHGCDVKRRHEELNTAIEKCFAHDTQQWILLLKLIHNIYIYKVQCCPAPLPPTHLWYPLWCGWGWWCWWWKY